MPKADIGSKEDIRLLIDTFYGKVRDHAILGPIFNDIAQVDWEHHMPKMVAFWEFILLDGTEYQGHPLRPHLALNSFHQLEAHHFEQWLSLFSVSIDELFEGVKANEAKDRALQIGQTWLHKINYINQQ
jgi:hemoglobin